MNSINERNLNTIVNIETDARTIPNSEFGIRNSALRCFIAFVVLATVLAGVITPSYLVKRDAARSLYENLTFMRIAVEARQYIQKIEYGVKNGKDLEQFYNINSILRDIQRCSSYFVGVYVVSSTDKLLYSMNQQAGENAPLRRPREFKFENTNDYYLYDNAGFFDLLLPLYDTNGTAYVIIRLDKDIVFYSTSGLVRQEMTRSLVIALEMLGLGLIVILIKKPKTSGIAVLTFVVALTALSADFGLSYIQYGSIAESAIVQSVNRIAQMLQNDINALRAMGISPDVIYDQNSWLKKSLQGIPMVHTMSIDSNMQVMLTVSKAYVSQYSINLLKSYLAIFAALFAAGALTTAARALRKNKLRVES